VDEFNLLSEYFWLIAVVGTCINLFGFRRRAQEYIREKPELRRGYEVLFRGYLIWMNVPWVVMGIGSTVGSVPSILHYFRPQDGNPYVLAWFASIFFILILGTVWIFFRGGAETLALHPGALQFNFGFKNQDIQSPLLIKFFWLLILASAIAGAVLMLSMDIPLQNFS